MTMPTISCRWCRLPIEASERARDGRVYCPHCRDWFAPGVDFDLPATAITSDARAASLRSGPPKYEELDDDAFDPVDAERERRIRRQRRHLGATENRSLLPPQGRGNGRAATILLGFVGVGEAALFGVYVWQTFRDAGPRSLEFVSAVSGLFEWLGFFLAGIYFILWLKQANRNVAFMRGPKLRWTSTWAAGGFFIPVVNLAIPYLVVQEAWKASDPGPTGNDSFEPRPSGRSVLIDVWWGIWVVANGLVLMSRYTLPLLPRMDWTMTLLLLAPHLLFAVDAALAILVVGSLIRRQETRWQAILAADAGADFGDEPDA